MTLRHRALPLALATIAPPTLVQKFGDTTDPTFTLRALDGKQSGPIAWDDPAVPSALGCSATYYDGDWDPTWDEIFQDTDFLDSVVHGLSYFFHRDIVGYAEQPVRFKLRAQDMGGVAWIDIRIKERGVVTNRNGVVSDGPTEFSNISGTNAYAFLAPVYFVGGQFSHWEKRLRWTRPSGPSHLGKSLFFSLNTFGSEGRIRVIVSDEVGNIRSDSVYLADDRLCH